MPSICFISSTDKKNSAYKEELARDLQREGITIASSLINCQVMILLQNIETAQSPQVKMLLASAQQLISQQQREDNVRSVYEDFLQTNKMTLSPYIQTLLESSQELIQRRSIQRIVRFVYEDIEPLPEGWDTLTAIDATENRAAATKQLASFILHAPNTTTPSIQTVQPSNNRTASLPPVLPSLLNNQSLKSQSHTLEQLNASIDSAPKQAERNNFVEEDGSKQGDHSPEHSKPEPGELDHPIESQASTLALPLTEEKPASEDLANTFKNDEVLTTTVMSSIDLIKNEPDTLPLLGQTDVQVISKPDTLPPLLQTDVQVISKPDTLPPLGQTGVQIINELNTQPPVAQPEKKAIHSSSVVQSPLPAQPLISRSQQQAEKKVVLPPGGAQTEKKVVQSPVAQPEKKALQSSPSAQPPISRSQQQAEKKVALPPGVLPEKKVIQSSPPAQPLISRSQQPVREAKANASPGPRPSSPQPAPRLPEHSQPVKPKHDAPPSRLRRWWPLAVIFAVLLIAFLVKPSSPAQKPRQAAPRAAQVVGYAYLFSSDITNANNTTGINDGLQIDLSHITPPASGTQYYGWLLPDLNQPGGLPISLGVMPVQGGAIKVRFINPTNTDLLAQASQFLITQESAALTPTTPSSNHSTWRYYAQLPQQPGAATMDMMHLSFLDHLRHMLVEDPDLAKLGAHGGISLWTKDNTRKVLEWANAARGSGVPQGYDVMHRQFIRILDYLDGASYVKLDLPAKSPFLADQVGGHFGLLTIRANENPPGYLQEMDMHLQEMVSSPGTTSSERALAKQIDAALSQVQTNLEQARQDDIKLVNTPKNRLQSKVSTNLLADLVEQVNDSYTGLYDPQTGARTQGITWVCDQLQHLATYEVKTYTPDQAPTQIPTQTQMVSNSKM